MLCVSGIARWERYVVVGSESCNVVEITPIQSNFFSDNVLVWSLSLPSWTFERSFAVTFYIVSRGPGLNNILNLSHATPATSRDDLYGWYTYTVMSIFGEINNVPWIRTVDRRPLQFQSISLADIVERNCGHAQTQSHLRHQPSAYSSHCGLDLKL